MEGSLEEELVGVVSVLAGKVGVGCLFGKIGRVRTMRGDWVMDDLGSGGFRGGWALLSPDLVCQYHCRWCNSSP